MNAMTAARYLGALVAALSLPCAVSSSLVAQSIVARRDTLSAVAVDTLPISSGARIRLRLDERPGWEVGVLQGQDSGRVQITRCQTCRIENFPVSQITAAQLSQGRTGNHIVAGALVGGLIGTAVGALLVSNKIHNTHPCDTCGLAILAVPEFTGGGVFLGTLVGALWRHERWTSLVLH